MEKIDRGTYTLDSFVGRQRTFWIQPPIICHAYEEYDMVDVPDPDDKTGQGKMIKKRRLVRAYCEAEHTGIIGEHSKSWVMAKLALNDNLADLAMGKVPIQGKHRDKQLELKEHIKQG